MNKNIEKKTRHFRSVSSSILSCQHCQCIGKTSPKGSFITIYQDTLKTFLVFPRCHMDVPFLIRSY